MTKFSTFTLEEKMSHYDTRRHPRESDFQNYDALDVTGFKLLYWGHGQRLYKMFSAKEKRPGVWLLGGEEPVRIRNERGKIQKGTQPNPGREARRW